MIKFSCPECETPLKVADDKGGSKIACPSCKAKVGVPGGATAKVGAAAAKAGAPKKRFRDDDYEDEELDRDSPKGEKKGSPAGLYIGVGIAAVLILGGGVAFIALHTSDKPKTTPTNAAGPGFTQVPPGTSSTPATAGTNTGGIPANTNTASADNGSSKGQTGDTATKPDVVATKPADGSAGPGNQVDVHLDAEKIVERLLKSTVYIHVQSAEGSWSGSGSLIDKENRLILTNYHVAHDGEDLSISVMFPQYQRNGELLTQKESYRNQLRKGEGGIRGWVVKHAMKKDLSLVRLPNLPDGVLALPISRTSAKPGQRVHSLGNPVGTESLWVYTFGAVRGYPHREQWRVRDGKKTLEFDMQVLQTQSPTNHGDSGGPMVNDYGELVAVTEGAVLFDVKAGAEVNLMSTFVDVSEVRNLVNAFYKSIGEKKEVVTGGGSGAFPTNDVVALLKILREDKNPQVRAKAALGLGQMGPEAKSAIADLLGCLKDKDDELRKRSAQALETIGSMGAVHAAALASALKDTDVDVRTYVAKCLGRMGRGAKSATPSLIEALKDNDGTVRKECAAVLGKIGPDAQDAVPGLIELLKDQEVDVTATAATALGKIGPAAKAAVPALSQALKAEDKLVKLNAIAALEGLGAEAKTAVPDLSSLLRTGEKDVRLAACAALGSIGPDAKQAIRNMLLVMEDEQTMNQVVDSLVKIGKDAVPELTKALIDTLVYVRWGAVEALGRIGPDASAALQALERRRKMDKYPQVQAAAARAIRKIQAK